MLHVGKVSWGATSPVNSGIRHRFRGAFFYSPSGRTEESIIDGTKKFMGSE